MFQDILEIRHFPSAFQKLQPWDTDLTEPVELYNPEGVTFDFRCLKDMAHRKQVAGLKPSWGLSPAEFACPPGACMGFPEFPPTDQNHAC